MITNQTGAITFAADLTVEDDTIRLDRMTGAADRAYARADYLDFYNLVTLAPISNQAERQARAFIGLTDEVA